jgi:hypothetical protein
MPLVPHSPGAVSYLLFPKHRITFESSEGEITLTVPTELGVEMYRVGILPQNENEIFTVCVSGKLVGSYKVIKFLYPINYERVVIITLQKC